MRKKVTYGILVVAIIAIIINLAMTDFDKFWQVNTLFKFSIPLLAVIIVVVMIRSGRVKSRNSN